MVKGISIMVYCILLYNIMCVCNGGRVWRVVVRGSLYAYIHTIMEWCLQVSVLLVDLCTCPHQPLHHLQVAPVTCPVQHAHVLHMYVHTWRCHPHMQC